MCRPRVDLVAAENEQPPVIELGTAVQAPDAPDPAGSLALLSIELIGGKQIGDRVGGIEAVAHISSKVDPERGTLLRLAAVVVAADELLPEFGVGRDGIGYMLEAALVGEQAEDACHNIAVCSNKEKLWTEPPRHRRKGAEAGLVRHRPFPPSQSAIGK